MKYFYICLLSILSASVAFASFSPVDLVIEKETCVAPTNVENSAAAKIVEICKRKANAYRPDEQYLVPAPEIYSLFSVTVESDKGAETRVYRVDANPFSAPMFYHVGNLARGTDILVGGGPILDVSREDGSIRIRGNQTLLVFSSAQGPIEAGAVVEIPALDLVPASTGGAF